MTSRSRVLLINPRITEKRHARFPLSIMNIAAALEPRYQSTLLDGNIDADILSAACEHLRSETYKAIGVTVMGGPQVATAIEISGALRSARPDIPIIWGGYFPTLYPDAALNSEYVDFVVRGQGEDTIFELLDSLDNASQEQLHTIDGLSWKRGEEVAHNRPRTFTSTHVAPLLRYEQLPDAKAYAVETFLGKQTVGHQAALGCRFRCTFCGVAAMFQGAVGLPPAERLDRELSFLKQEIGADSIQFYDHNFFDREIDMVPLLEVLSQHELPWWCYARADALINLSPESWHLIRKSKLRMAYIGAETPNDELLRSIRKGTRSEQTLQVAELCRQNGVIPELSFMVAPPQDPEGETERTFEFIRRLKRVNPDSEIIVYIYTPIPSASISNSNRGEHTELLDIHGKVIDFPRTPEEWTKPQWVDYACHRDAPWLSDRLRMRIRDFVTVLRCRYPTIQDTRSPPWAKLVLRGLASWRYALRQYDNPWELDASHRLIGLSDPRATSI